MTLKVFHKGCARAVRTKNNTNGQLYMLFGHFVQQQTRKCLTLVSTKLGHNYTQIYKGVSWKRIEKDFWTVKWVKKLMKRGKIRSEWKNDHPKQKLKWNIRAIFVRIFIQNDEIFLNDNAPTEEFPLLPVAVRHCNHKELSRPRYSLPGAIVATWGPVRIIWTQQAIHLAELSYQPALYNWLWCH